MTRIRPCIDLHEGKVKQIVGSTLKDTKPADNGEATATASVNFSSDEPASSFSSMYERDSLTGGHVIMLGQNEANRQSARGALAAWKGGWQIGGGITDENCREWLDAGASHVIVTSFVFHQGVIDYERLDKLIAAIGKDKLVLDLSCRKKEDGQYYVVTNKWQTFTDTAVTPETLQKLAGYCSEFLVHAVDVEGKQSGIQQDLVEYLGQHCPIPVTYAGGVRSIDDLNLVEKLGNGKVDVTVGSALDIFGGSLPYKDVVAWHKQRNS